MKTNYKFNCGCTFEVDDGCIQFTPQWDSLNYECKATWDLISSGNTKGLFQIESSFGRQLCKRARVDSIDELSNLIAAQRPGATQSFLEDGKSLSEHYFMRKNGEEEVVYLHPALEPYLKSTKGILIFQEQQLDIAINIAGFTSIEADNLRKAIAKKLQDKLAQLKEPFIEGCKRLGKINEAEANTIFTWLQAAGRYSFNSSHSCSYAYITYLTAYLKAHFPPQFFQSWLSHAGDKPNKQEEIQELTTNLKQMDLILNGPDFRLLNHRFCIKDKQLYFGLADIKDVGKASLEKTMNATSTRESSIGPRANWTENDLIFGFLPYIWSTVANNLICSGAFDYIKSKRTYLKYQYENIVGLYNTASWPWIEGNYKNYKTPIEVVQNLLEIGGLKEVSKKKVRVAIQSLESPPYALEDTAAYLAGEERRLLGVAITCTEIDGCDVSSANCNIQDFINGKGGYILIGVNVDNIKEVTIKNGNSAGKRMAFISISDSSSSMQDVPVFTETWSKYKGYLTHGNTVMVAGKRGRDKGLLIEKVFQL